MRKQTGDKRHDVFGTNFEERVNPAKSREDNACLLFFSIWKC